MSLSGQPKDAHEAASQQHENAGKALRPTIKEVFTKEIDGVKPSGMMIDGKGRVIIDYTTCPCGYSTHAIVKQNGNAWICDDPKCAEKSRFEEVKR